MRCDTVQSMTAACSLDTSNLTSTEVVQVVEEALQDDVMSYRKALDSL